MRYTGNRQFHRRIPGAYAGIPQPPDGRASGSPGSNAADPPQGLMTTGIKERGVRPLRPVRPRVAEKTKAPPAVTHRRHRQEITTEFVHRRALPSAFDIADPSGLPNEISPDEMRFVHRVTELLPILSPEQVDALRERIDSGYYGNEEITSIIADKLAAEFGTD